MSGTRYGLIEAGGTKFVLGLADVDGVMLNRHRIPTLDAAETIAAALDWFRSHDVPYAGFGVASFGPLDLDKGLAQLGQYHAYAQAGLERCQSCGAPLRTPLVALSRLIPTSTVPLWPKHAGGRAGQAPVPLPHHRHGRWRWRRGGWSHPPWAEPPRNGAHAPDASSQ